MLGEKEQAEAERVVATLKLRQVETKLEGTQKEMDAMSKASRLSVVYGAFGVAAWRSALY